MGVQMCGTLAACFLSLYQSWLFTAVGNNNRCRRVSYPFLLPPSVEQTRRINYLQLAHVHATRMYVWYTAVCVCVCVRSAYLCSSVAWYMCHDLLFSVFNEAATLICALRQQTSKGATLHTCMLHSCTAIALHGICISICSYDVCTYML